MANERKLIYADSGEIAAEYMKKHIVPSDSDFLRGYLAGVDAVAKGLAKLPPVDAVEVVHGWWIEKEYVDEPYGGYYLFHCSECCVPNAQQRNYCPNCGAKMDGGADYGL